MTSESQYEQRCARVRRIFGTDDLAMVAKGLRERRAALVAVLLRRVFTAVLPERGTKGLAQTIRPRRRIAQAPSSANADTT